MKCISGYDWGAEKEELLNIYRALVRSTYDCGCMIYTAVANTNLEKLD